MNFLQSDFKPFSSLVQIFYEGIICAVGMKIIPYSLFCSSVNYPKLLIEIS